MSRRAGSLEALGLRHRRTERVLVSLQSELGRQLWGLGSSGGTHRTSQNSLEASRPSQLSFQSQARWPAQALSNESMALEDGGGCCTP